MEEGVELASSPKDIFLDVVKGKRTKRPRSLSPVSLTFTNHLSGVYTNGDYNLINHNNILGSSSGENGSCAHQDEETMANCLVLLSKGHCFKEPSNKIDQDSPSPAKFISKRYIETCISTGGKSGMYMFQCKTCGRSFSSFQALGGHRASHKKLKKLMAGDQTYSNIAADKSRFPKVHKCSYCGAAFASGQALGGHMRRHRGAAPPAGAITEMTFPLGSIPISTAYINQDSDQDNELSKPRNGLSLDLNLPAPEEDVHVNYKQQEQHKESAIVLSTRRLIEIECHY